jgi:GNAT superfamily N-acetyltransferase
MKGISIRRLEPGDRALVIRLLDTLHVSIGYLAETRLYRAMCNSAEICTVVAMSGGCAAGVALVELNRRWIWRRPFLLARMLVSRIRTKYNRSNSTPVKTSCPELPFFISRSTPAMQWTDPGPRVLFIGVDLAWRGRGIGKQLYERMFRELRSVGHVHLRARIACDNTSSLHLHHQTGWQLFKDGDVVLAIRRLASPEPGKKHNNL